MMKMDWNQNPRTVWIFVLFCLRLRLLGFVVCFFFFLGGGVVGCGMGLDVEQDHIPWGLTGTSSGNCQEINSQGFGMSHATTASSGPSFRAP